MPVDGGAGLGLGSRLLGPVLKPIVELFFRKSKLADAELAALRASLEGLLADVDASSVQAQMTVRGSANDEETQAAARSAVELATTAGQKMASLFEIHTVSNPDVDLINARLAYREAVTDDGNLDAMEGVERNQRCEKIEVATATFHSALVRSAWRKWGAGVGARSGRLRDRKLPR